MFDALALIHLPGSPSESVALPTVECEGWVVWRTCLRAIWIGTRDRCETPDAFGLEVEKESYQGVTAYGFLLEVICGLHSPLIGETEVMGQFRDLAREVAAREDLAPLREVFRSLLADAKTVRRNHLMKLGSQSYGSLTRKILKSAESVHVLGSGKLAEEILPWLDRFRRVEVFSRNPEKRTMLSQKFPAAFFTSLVPTVGDSAAPEAVTESPLRSALVVAAPMSAEEITAWIRDHGHPFEMLVDLRGESATDPLPRYAEGPALVQLEDFFSAVKTNLSTIRGRVAIARAAINDLSRARANFQELRPFGWEDLCG